MTTVEKRAARTGIRRDEIPALQASPDVEVVPHLVQLAGLAAQRDLAPAVQAREGALDLGRGVGLVRRGTDVGAG